MTRDDFWKLVEATRSGGDPERQLEAIAQRLSQLPAEKIVEFDRHLGALLDESYSWELWGAAYLINGGCSDDGFDYFRSWLIAQGRAAYEKAVKSPDSLADLEGIGEEAELEELWYVAREAYEAKTGDEVPAREHKLPELGDGWDFDDNAEMKQRYPRLFAKFGE